MVALSLNLFLVPNKIAAGGFSGIATVVYYVSYYKLPVGMTMLALNIPAFILGVKTIGVDFGVKSIYGTVILSVLTDTTTFVPCITYDKLLASVFGGALMGIGLAIVYFLVQQLVAQRCWQRLFTNIFRLFLLVRFF